MQYVNLSREDIIDPDGNTIVPTGLASISETYLPANRDVVPGANVAIRFGAPINLPEQSRDVTYVVTPFVLAALLLSGQERLDLVIYIRPGVFGALADRAPGVIAS